MSPSKVLRVAAILLVLEVGCSTNTSAPPDPSLSYEVVAQNVTQYRGKRVRWYGQFVSGKAKDKMIGKGSSLSAVFVDPATDLRVALRAFAVEAESPKDNITFMFDVQGKPCWVTGTIAGSRKEKVTVGPPPIEKEVDIPLLRNAQFEQAQEPGMK